MRYIANGSPVKTNAVIPTIRAMVRLPHPRFMPRPTYCEYSCAICHNCLQYVMHGKIFNAPTSILSASTIAPIHGANEAAKSITFL